MTTTESTTTTPDNPQVTVRLDFEHHAAGFYRAVVHLDQAATKELDKVDFDPRLRELVRIRASQLNGCAYCIDMHTKDARAIGETERRRLRRYGGGKRPLLHLPGHLLLRRQLRHLPLPRQPVLDLRPLPGGGAGYARGPGLGGAVRQPGAGRSRAGGRSAIPAVSAISHCGRLAHQSARATSSSGAWARL